MELNIEELKKILRDEAVTSEKFFIHFLQWINRANYEEKSGSPLNFTRSYFRKENHSEQEWIGIKKRVEAYNRFGFIKRWWLRNTDEEYKNITLEAFQYHSHYLRFYLNYILLYSPELKMNNTIVNHAAIYTAFYESLKHIKPLLEIIKPKTGFSLLFSRGKKVNQGLKVIELAYKEYYESLKRYQGNDWPFYPEYLNMVARREYIGRTMMLFLNQLPKTNFENESLYSLKKMIRLHEYWEKKVVLREKATFLRINPAAFLLSNHKIIGHSDNSFPFVAKAGNYVTGDKLIAWDLIPIPKNPESSKKNGVIHFIEDKIELPEFMEKLRPLLSSKSALFLNIGCFFRHLFNKKSRFQQEMAKEELEILEKAFKSYYDNLLKYSPDLDRNDLKESFYLNAQKKLLQSKIIAFIRDTMPDPESTPEGLYFLKKINSFYERWSKVLDKAENKTFESLNLSSSKTAKKNPDINTINEEEYISLDQLLSWASCQQSVFEDMLNEKRKAELKERVNLPFFITNIYRWLKYQESYYNQMTNDERKTFLEGHQARVRTFFLNLRTILDKNISPIFVLKELKEFEYLNLDSPIYQIFKAEYSYVAKEMKSGKGKVDSKNEQAAFNRQNPKILHSQSDSLPGNKSHDSFFSHQRTSSLSQTMNNRPRTNLLF